MGPFPRLHLTVRGIRKSQGTRFRRAKRLPVTPNILRTIKYNLFRSYLRFHDKCMLWSAMTIAFFGLLRASEYTCRRATTHDPQTELCTTDVSCDGYVARVNVKASKTDIFRTGSIIRIFANNSELCPISALERYLHVRSRQDGPLYIFANNKYLRRMDVSHYMKLFSGHTSNLSTHSFRIGAATTLANSGYPRWLIQSLGRWSSDCYRVYIRTADGTLSGVSNALVSEPAYTFSYDPEVA